MRQYLRRFRFKHLALLAFACFMICLVIYQTDFGNDQLTVDEKKIIEKVKDFKVVNYPKFIKRRSEIVATKFKEESSKSIHVINAMKHSWKAYKAFAWGKDEVYPLTNGSSTWMGAALTMIDSLDLLYIMNLKAEFNESLAWIAENLHFNLDKRHVNVFETIIRVLGGLLSAYDLCKEPMLLEKALDLGQRLMPAFHTVSGIPMSDINLKRKEASNPEWTVLASSSEAYTVILELYELSRLSGKKEYVEAAEKVVDVFHKAEGKQHGLIPIYIDPSTGMFNSHVITLGARGDSYYEYLLKYWIISGKKKKDMKLDYLEAISGVEQLLIKQSYQNHLTYVAELIGTQVNHKMDHLVCFLPGLLALGTLHGMPSRHLKLAHQLAYTCYQMYNVTATGLSPEIVYFHNSNSEDILSGSDIIIKEADKFNLQRPEALESFFYLYRITGDEKYAKWAWKIFQSFEKYSKVPWAGYVSIGNVQDSFNVRQYSKCESFWYSETLKYMYLIMRDWDYRHNIKTVDGHSTSLLFPLDKFVFNTEAHPFPIV